MKLSKKNLLELINKYHLSGTIERVKWEIKNKQLIVNFAHEDKTMLGTVVCKEFDIDNHEFGIYDTSSLAKIINIMDDDIEFDFDMLNGKDIKSLRINDKHYKSNFPVADLSVIPTSGKPKALPEFEVELEIGGDFIQRFIKAKNAVDSESFAIIAEDGEIKIVIGYQSEVNNTTKISFDTGLEYNGEFEPVMFSADNLKNILNENKNMETGKLFISLRGLMIAEFDSKAYSTKYYMVRYQTIQ
jgi:hypothetical protein